MNLHYVAVGLLVASFAQNAISGGFTRILLKKLNEKPVEEARNRFHNAVLALLFVTVSWIGLLALLILPGVPASLEMGAGMLIIAGTIAAAIYTQAMSLRTFLLVAAGSLILLEHLT